MVSQIGGSAGFSSAMLSGTQCRGPRDAEAVKEKLFTTLDTDGDGGVSEAELGEFLDFAASSSGTSSVESSELFKTLDSDGDGAVSQTELDEGARSLFDQLRTQLMSAQGGSQASAPPKPDPSEMFASIDTNGDGAINQDELGAFFECGPPAGRGGEHGMKSAIDSLLDQYRSASGAYAATAESSTLSVSA